jgi:hypothetical protein
MTMTDLGWLNAGGETERKINEARNKCMQAKHAIEPPSNEGGYGTVHTVHCDVCGYSYHWDSGD